MWEPAERLHIEESDRALLKKWVEAPTTTQRTVRRSRIVLAAAEGTANRAIAAKLGVSRPTVLLWRRRFAEDGPSGLTRDRPRGCGKPPLSESVVRKMIEATLHEKPPGQTHWSVRSMARAQGISPAAVQRIWVAHGLKPHLVKTFKLSNDPRFVEKLRDVVGLYRNPPENALVLCVDEKSQIQALDRTQPGLPLKRGRAGTMTHDYKRNGTTTLFAALNVLEGTVIAECMGRQRHQEFLRFLKRLDREIPKHLDLHLILDNYQTHKHAAVRAWLERKPRFHFHFIPTSSPWLNLVERWLGGLTTKAIRRGAFQSVNDLVKTIYDYVEHSNENSRPFVWTATADSIIAKVTRGKAMLETVHYVNNWADVLQVWSDRYATKVSGWWIDHAYQRYAVSVTARGASNPEFAIYRDHLLSGNPNSIVAFNHGWRDLDAHTPEEDYRSGHERAIAESVASSRWWHGLQWHYLSRLGPGLWGSEGIRYDTQVLIDYVNENNRHEGANTFSVFVYSKPGESAEGIVKSPGNLSNAQIRQLSALRDASLQFVDDTSDDVTFVGTWERMDDELDFRGSTTGSDEADAHAELAFSGIGVEVVVRRGRNGGLVDVELDGDVVLDDFDTYSRATAFKQVIYTNKNLDAGSHTVRLVATGRKSAGATAADAMLDNFAVTMADTMRPRVLSVTSDASHPTKDSFTVTIDFLEDVTGLRAGEISVSNGSVSNFAGSGASYTLDIAPTAGLEGEVTVDVPANAVVDGASNGNLEGSETFAVDTRVPVIQTAVANQAVLTLVYGEALDPLSVPPASAFTLTGGGAPRTISNVVVNGSRVVFSIDPPASYGEAGLQVGYSAPSGGALVDALGNKVPSFTNQAVANESPGTTLSTDTWITGATAFSVREGDTAVATLTATEAATAAGDPVWWIPSGAAGGPDGGKFALSRAGVLTFAAAKDFEAPDDANADGGYQVTVQLSVGALTAAADLTVTLTNRNEAPVADARAVQPIVAQGATATLSGSGSDPDADDTLTYAWTQTGTPAVALSDTAAASPTFTAPSNLTEDTTLSFTLRVADSSGLYHEDAVSVTVQENPLLTAAFENAPARHDGSTPFAVDLRFSDEVALWYSAFTSGLLTTTGGTVQRASRLVLRSNIGWRIPVTPDGDGDVVITLPANRPCSWLTGACARDGRKLAVAASVTVPGPVPSPAPDITSAAAFTVQEGETAVGTLTATDADTQASGLSWSLSGGADQAKFAITSAGALSFAGVKDYEAPDDANTDGAYQVTVQVSDGGRTDTADLTVTLTNVNEAPTADAGPDQPGVEPGAQVTLSGTGTDPDAGDTLSYAWTQTGGTSVTLTGGATATATFTLPSGAADDDEFTFKLKVADAAGLSAEDSVRVTVRAVASTDPAATVEVLNEDFDDGDADGWTVYDGSWSVTDGTYGVNGGGERKAVAAAIDVADFVLEAEVRVKSNSGDSGVVFRVSDPGTGTDNYKGYYVGVATDSSLVFGKANAGRWEELDRENLAFTSGLWYRLKVVASGASIRVYVSDVLTIEATDDTYDSGAIGLRTWRAEADWDNVAVAKILEEDSVGFRVTAAPGEIDEGAATTVTVATVNGATFAEAQDIALEVSGSASAADYEMASTGLTLAAGTAAVSVELTAVDDEAEEAAETVTVTAARGGSEIGSATVTIRASDEAAVVEPAAPEISSASTFSVAEDTTAVATLAATDADTQASGLTWSLSGGADQAKFAITSAGALSFAEAKDYEAPDDANTDGAYQVTVQVSDGGRTDTADLTVTLTNANEAPTADAGPDQPGVEPGAQVTLGGTGTDPDAGDTLSYAWTQTGGTSVTLTGGATATATFAAPDDLPASEELTFRLRVTDAGGLHDDDTVRVTVQASDESSSTESDVEWGERLRDRDIVLPSGSKPTGLWSDGTTLWVLSEWNSGQVLTYSLADGTRLTEGEVTLPDGVTPGSSSFRLTGNGFPAGLWSDGTTLWVADYFGGVRAYRLADGARLETDDLPDDVLAAAGNSAPTGLWSDGEFLWVTDHWQYQVFAYRLSDKARVADEEFELWDGLTPYGGFGLWSDGETALVGPSFYARVLAHSLATGEQQAERTVDLSADGVRRSNGLWSDGETLWVANERHNRIYAYAVPGLRRASARNALRTQSEDLGVRVQTETRGKEVSVGESTADTPAAIPDPVLSALIAPALGKESGEPISLREIAALTMEKRAPQFTGR